MTREAKISDELLQRHHDDELTALERAEVEASLDGDARARLAALGELHDLLSAHSVVESAHVDFSSTIAAIERGAPAAAPPPKRSRRRLLPVSVIGLLGAAAASLFMFFRPVHPHPLSNEAQIESLEVEGGQATVLRMQDGTDPGQTTTVIWASLEDEASDVAIDPLNGKETL